MASTKEYLDFVLDQLSDLEDIRCRQMMGEYIIYYKGKIIGGIYDDRFLVKPTKSVMEKIPNAFEVPYDGAKELQEYNKLIKTKWLILIHSRQGLRVHSKINQNCL